MEADAKLIRWVRKNETAGSVAKFVEGGSPRWLEVTLEAWGDDRVHLHVEVSREELEPDDPKTSSVVALKKLIAECVSRINGDGAAVRFRGRLPVKRAEIPETSSLAKLLGFSTKSCGASMKLTGAHLDIDDEVFQRLTFSYDDDQEVAYVTLWAFAECEIGEDYMGDLAELMEVGADCFVFERITREASHV